MSRQLGKYLILLEMVCTFIPVWSSNGIDRHAVVIRNNPHVTALDSLQSFTVGNGEFAMTVDATGLQTFPKLYSHGVCLGTMSDWGWHSFANPKHYTPADVLEPKDFGKGHKELYSLQFKQPGRQRDACNWLRANPHRLHLGSVGLNLSHPNQLNHIQESLDMWTGKVSSSFFVKHDRYQVQTVCSPLYDRVSSLVTASVVPSVRIRFAYPTGGHSDDACNWQANSKHTTLVIKKIAHAVLLKRKIDATVYYVLVSWKGKADFIQKRANDFLLKAVGNQLDFSVEYSEDLAAVKSHISGLGSFALAERTSAEYWQRYWEKGGIVDFSQVKDPRGRELERRIILSQYLLAVNDAGTTPPQETGLTYNSWFGKFHLEMTWWHLAHFALWGHPELLDRVLSWYQKVEPVARVIARRQGFDGVRWMKMTDPSGLEAPSNVGSYLIWQQPHLIYLAELLYRAHPSKSVLDKYGHLVEETAKFMYSFASYDSVNHRYVLKGCIPAQETLNASSTVNPPFELSYWHYALGVAQKWREREGLQRSARWDSLISQLSPLAANSDSLYLAAESVPETYKDIRYTSDHPAVLGALGILPDNSLINKKIMNNTLNWVMKKWNWDKTWGWDFPMTAMCAVRLHRPDTALEALMMKQRTNTYLVNGYNYQDDRLRIYLPGNGGLLAAVALMCAGWDGNKVSNPGFPKDWNVKWEGILPLP